MLTIFLSSAGGQFIFPLVLSSITPNEPLTVWLASLSTRHGSPFNVIDAAAIVSIALPSLIVFLFHRWIVDGIDRGGGGLVMVASAVLSVVVGRHPRPQPQGRCSATLVSDVYQP
jgi:hypothetical protein